MIYAEDIVDQKTADEAITEAMDAAINATSHPNNYRKRQMCKTVKACLDRIVSKCSLLDLKYEEKRVVKALEKLRDAAEEADTYLGGIRF